MDEIFVSEKELDNGEFRCSNCDLNDICLTHELSCPFQEVKSLEQHDRELLNDLLQYLEECKIEALEDMKKDDLYFSAEKQFKSFVAVELFINNLLKERGVK